MKQNNYSVVAQFERSRYHCKTETWNGPARNMSVATRKAIKEILTRRGVKRLRHVRVTFFVEKIVK